MTIQYGLTVENQKLIDEKSKGKKDGVYSFRGVIYRVVNGYARLFAVRGQVLESSHGFNVIIGSYDLPFGSDESKIKKLLKDIKAKR